MKVAKSLKFIFPMLVLLFVQGQANAQGGTPNEIACYNMVQGKVAWNAAGNTQWSDPNIRALCVGSTDASLTVACFQRTRAATDDWAKAINACVAKPFVTAPPKAPVTVATLGPKPPQPAKDAVGSSLIGGKDLVPFQGPYLFRDIAIGSTGGVWAIGQKKMPGGYGPIMQFSTGNWSSVSGGAMQITVDDAQHVWIVNEFGGIFFRHSDKWNPFPSPPAVNLVFRNDQMWMVGTDGYARRWDNASAPSGAWVDAAFVGKGAKSITHATSGWVMAVTEAGKIYRRGASGWWASFNGTALDIAANKKDVWIIDETGALSIQTPTGWERRFQGPFVSLAVDLNGEPWAATASGLLMLPPIFH
ncbi:MAG TPA: hypothetical protein VGO43_02940 [Pyrinomonadaceae bacterium]|nr:hypothetical protein [Pyrinomonadaceae bacterium]